MRARNYKSKAAKEIDNYARSSNIISDSYYTTETNDTRVEYGYGRGFNKYDDDYYKYFEGDEPRRSIDTFTNPDDVTSSSDDEKYNRRKNSPRSKSEKIYSRKYSNSQTRQRRRNQSPREYEAREEDRRRSRPKYRDRNRLESASEQTLDYRPPRSPKTHYQYNFEEEDLFLKKYFEPAERRVKEKRLEHLKRERRIQEGADREFKDRKERVEKSNRQHREYQVYAALENAKPHTNVFAGKTTNNGNSELSSEIELKTHEYPVLAFKERTTTISKDSDMVYVPVFIMDKKNKKNNQNASPVNRKPIPQENNYQVYAANLENRNYFEKMGKAFNQTFSGSHSKKNSIEKRQSPNKFPAFDTETQYIESLLNKTEYSFKQTDSNFSPTTGTLSVQPPLPRETSKFSKETTTTKTNPFGHYQPPIVYKVKIDAATAMEKESNRWSQVTQKQDDLHDDYPVTKDYIKVNGSEDRRPSNVVEKSESIDKPTRQSIKSGSRNPSVFVDVITDEKTFNSISEKSKSIDKPTRQSTKAGSRNPSVFVDVLTDEKISHSIYDSKDAARHKSIVKDSLPTRNLSIPDESSPEKSSGVGKRTLEGSLKRSMVEAKSGSLSIPFNTIQEVKSEVRNTQGSIRLSINEPEKQGMARKSTTEHFESQPNSIRLSRKSTVPQKSSVATVAKQPSIFTARESGSLGKKLSSIKFRFSQVKPQSLSSNPIPETIIEPRKSEVQPATDFSLETPETQTQPTVPATLTSIELRQSLMQAQKTAEDSPSDKRKSQISPDHKVPGTPPQSIQQNLASEDLRELTNIDLDADHKKEPSLTKASLSKTAEPEPTRISETTPATLHEEPTEADLRKSQAFKESNTEKADLKLSEERMTSEVNFSPNLENIPSPARDSLKNVSANEEKPHPGDVKTSTRTSPVVEDSGDVAKPVDRRSESRKSKPTVDQPPIQKSDSGSKPKKLVSRIFNRRSQSKSDVKTTPSKSLISKRSKQSVAKEEKKTKTKKAPSKSFLGILKRSRSNISNKSRASTNEEVPSEQKTEEARQQKATITKNNTEGSMKPREGSTKPREGSTKPKEGSTKSTEGSTKAREAKMEESKPCECPKECAYMIAECGHFFLGTTLHEQIMNILKIMN